MAANQWIIPKFTLNHLGAAKVNMASDTFKMGLIAAGANVLAARSVTETWEFVSDLLTNNGNALTEVSTVGTGYARFTLASVTYTLSGLVITFTSANPTIATATLSTTYGWIHDETASGGTDATRPLFAIFDFGGAQSPSGVPLTVQVSGSGIWQNTASQ